MKFSLDKKEEIYGILKNYKGINPYIQQLQRGVYLYKNITLNDFHFEYIATNYNTEPVLINKIVKVADWWGEKKQIDWELEFIPEKIKIGYFMGETSEMYHMYIQYRKSQTEMLSVFIPKKAILTNFLAPDWRDKEIDFEKYNKLGNIELKPHQQRAIKFLSTRPKSILSLDMGLGKSLCAVVSALENNFNKILIICPASLKTNWKNEISRFVDEEEITIVEGSKWKENKFTIINYDILKNFYTVPKETKQVKEKNYTDDGEIKWSTVEKVVKTNKTDIVNNAMNNSQLFQSQFDLIIIDEAHRLSNKKSGMYEIVEDLISRTNPQGIYELTGTMVTNSPINLYNILKLIGADITNDWVYYVKRYCDGKQIFRNRKERDYFSTKFIHEHKKNTWYDLTKEEKASLDEYLTKNCKKIWLTNGSSNLEELGERIKHLYYRETSKESLKNIKKETQIVNYTLTDGERLQYNNAWNEYIKEHGESNIDTLIANHKLIEGSVFRQLLANFMVERSIKLAEEEISKGSKVIIFCCFDKELYSLQEYFGDRCVVYNGKMTSKKKDSALNSFKTDSTKQVFIGNLQSASVGLNINESNVIIFNNISFLPAENQQAEYRILRLGQTKDCKIFYQKFNDTYMDRMFEILDIKNGIIDNVIKDEENK